MTSSTTVRAAEHQVSSDVGGETVIFDVDGGTYYGLDAVGTRIWTLLQKPRTIEEIHRQIVGEYDVTPEQCRQDLFDLLEDLHERKLIIVEDETIQDEAVQDE